MSDKLKYYCYISNEEVFNERNWQIGDTFDLPCFGRLLPFKLVKRTKQELQWESGKLWTSFRSEKDYWIWDRTIINGDALARIKFS